MSAVITDFRVFQSAAQYAKRAGIPQREAVHQVAEAQREGHTGYHVAGQLQHRASKLVTIERLMQASLDILSLGDKPGPEAA